jgi:TonB-linked SusC/RagA family outer membrane protein
MTGQIDQFRRWVATAVALVAVPVSAVAQAQETPVTITGRVTNEMGEPLRAANVSIPELNLFVMVSPQGTYRLIVPAARAQRQQVALRARMIGYQAQALPIRLTPGATIERDFRLVADPLRLEEVVVTGAGTASLAERLGTVRASVDAQTITRANEPSVVQALAGKIPGVVTNQGSGDPGASTAIQIRGAKSIIGTSQPTIIVDGVPVNNITRNPLVGDHSVLEGPPMSNRGIDINPEDIESIEILKGAAAASIYGASAGSSGAILITTKRGRAGGTQYTLRSNFQADEPIKTVPYQNKYGVGAGGVSTACTTVNCIISSGFFSWGPALAPGTPTYDHAAEIFETGRIIDNTLSVSGGNERTTFYVSGAALDHNGFIVGDSDFLRRYTARFNGSHALTENLTIAASGSYVQARMGGQSRGNGENGVGLTVLRQPPEFNAKQYLDPITGFHRSWRFPNPGPNAASAASFTRGFDNPFYAINENELTAQTGRFYGNVSANYRPLSWLQLQWTLGGDYTSDDRTYAYGQAASATPGGLMERWQFYDRIIDHNLTVTGTHSFSPNINAGLTLGQNLNETYFRQIDVVGQTWIAPRPYKLSNTVSRTIPSDDETRRRIDGYFAQATTDLYDQVFLQARIRNDGNSSFGVSQQRAWYPGASIAWSFTKTFGIAPRVLSFGKLRTAYGESGQQPPLYTTQDIFSNTAFADFSPASIQAPTLNNLGGLYASVIRGNPNIRPERARELEAGFDLGLFGGRADVSVTRYDSRSSDVVFNVPLPPSTGYTSVFLNAGKLENKGWEVAANYRALQARNFSVEIGANWAMNRNKVLSLGTINGQTCTAETQAECPPGTILVPTPENCGPTANVPRCQTAFGSAFSGQTTHAQVGYPIGTWRSTDFARCGRGLTTITIPGAGTHDVGAACVNQPDGALYIAADGFPITDPNTRAIGNPWPDWTAGLSTTIGYKGVQLSAFLDHRQGGDILNMTRASMFQYGTHKDTEIRGQTRTFGKDMLCHNQTCDVLNGPVVGPGAGTAVVIGEGWFSDGTKGPGGGLGAVGGPIAQRLEDGTHTRLREVSIAYTFNQPWVQKIGGSRSMDVKISARNVKLWTDYSGVDPETNIGGALNANRGIDWFGLPLTRAWVLSVALHH